MSESYASLKTFPATNTSVVSLSSHGRFYSGLTCRLFGTNEYHKTWEIHSKSTLDTDRAYKINLKFYISNYMELVLPKPFFYFSETVELANKYEKQGKSRKGFTSFEK